MHRRGFLAGIAVLGASSLAGCSDDAAWRDGDGLDLDALMESHAEALLEAGSFTLVSSLDPTRSSEERPSEWIFEQTYESRFERDREREFVEQDLTEVDETVTAYVADGEALYRSRTGEEVRYDRERVDRTSDAFESRMREEVLVGVRGFDRWNFTTDGTVDADDTGVSPVDPDGSEDGAETLHRFVADSFEGDRDVPRRTETAEAVALIDDDGRVRRIEQTWSGTHEGQTVEVTVGIEFQAIGRTHIEEPNWVDDARATGE